MLIWLSDWFVRSSPDASCPVPRRFKVPEKYLNDVARRAHIAAGPEPPTSTA